MTQIPTSPRTEAGLLAEIMSDEGAYDEVDGKISAETFFDANNATVFQAMERARKIGRPVNFTTVLESLDAMGKGALASYVMDLTATLAAVTTADAVSELRAVHQRREMIRALGELTAKGYDPKVPHAAFLADVEARIAAVGAVRADDKGLRKLDPQVAYDSIVDTIKRKGSANLSTTLSELDFLTSGLSPGHVMVVGGLPGSGKTGLAIQMLEECCLHRHQAAAFFSLEMPEADIAKRLLSRASGVRLASMRSGNLTADNVEAMNPVRDALLPAPLYIYDSPAPTIGIIRAESRRLCARIGPLGLLVIDYLQLARGVTKTDSREQEVAEVSRGIKALAKEIGCPVVALAQLNSDGAKRANSRPRASDLRESKAIWQDADTVALIHNPDYDKTSSGQADSGEREIILDKNRHGPCGVAKCRFDKVTATFLNPESVVTPWPTTTKRGDA